MLSPLGIYNLEEGLGAEEIKAIGKQLDEVFEALEELERESVPARAMSYGLTNYEELMPSTPAYITTEDENRALLALLRIRGGCFTLETLQDTLSGCGILARIAESGTALIANVSFPENRGIPDGFDKLKKRIEEIIPCHLGVEYLFIYSMWQELMTSLPSWAVIEASVQSWREFEIYE